MKAILVILLSSMISIQAWSWGALGHKTSARIAWSILDRETQNKVTAILNGGSITDAATWADAARPNQEWRHTIWYHFEKAPDNVTYLQNLERQSDKYRKLGGLIEALYISEDIFNDSTATRIDRENAMKFVIHFVADIHQPLHTGRVEDNSGNKIPVKWMGFDTNLHSVWDSQMIYLAYKDQLSIVGVDQSKVYSEILLEKFKEIRPTPDLFTRYDEWMHESMIPRADAYTYKDENEHDYTARFINVVDKRIYMAGVRIAYMIKRLVNLPTAVETIDPITTLRKSIISIVGNFTEFVSLKPRLPNNDNNEPIPEPNPARVRARYY